MGSRTLQLRASQLPSYRKCPPHSRGRCLPESRPLLASLPSLGKRRKLPGLGWMEGEMGGREMTPEPIHLEKVLRDFRLTNRGLSQHSPHLEEDPWRAGARRTQDPLHL